MSTIKAEHWINHDDTENYKCRVWVNFDGTGTVAIRASGNVSSVTDNSTGNYTVNFDTPIVDANYEVCVSSNTYNSILGSATNLAGSAGLTIRNHSDSLIDVANVNMSVHR